MTTPLLEGPELVASTDGWSLEQEVDDVVAVIDAAAARQATTVDVLGHSLGGLLSLPAAAATRNVRRLVVYEPAINHASQPDDVLDRMRQVLDEGRPDDGGQQHIADQMIPEEFARLVLRFLEDWHPAGGGVGGGGDGPA